VQALPARLRRKPCIDVDYLANSVFCFLADQTSKNSKARVEQHSIQARFRRNVATRRFQRPLGAARHLPDAQLLKGDHVRASHDPSRDLVRVIETRVRLTLLGARQPTNGGDPLRIRPIHASPSSISLRRRSNRALMHSHHTTTSLSVLAVLEQLPFARGGKNVNATIDPNDPPGEREGFRGTIAFENRIPPAVLLPHERAAELRNGATFPNAHRSETGDLYPRLIGIEFEGTVAVRIR
jgi:hypothetical protein